MDATDLRTFLDHHGQPGAPPLDGGAYIVETVSGTRALYVSTERTNALMTGWTVWDEEPRDVYANRCDMVRHAPLPPLDGRFVRCHRCNGGVLPCQACREEDEQRAAYGSVVGETAPHTCEKGTAARCPECGPASHPLATPGVRWEAGR